MHNTLVGLNLRHRMRLGCAGKVISAFDVARMIAGHCPTGVTTQDPQRQKALVVPDTAERVYRFHQNTLAALKELVQAAGLTHPRQISASHIVRRTGEQEVKLLANMLPFLKPGALLAAERGEAEWPHNVYRFYWPMAHSNSFSIHRVNVPVGTTRERAGALTAPF